MNRTERVEEAEIEAVIDKERNTFNHAQVAGQTAVYQALPVIERTDAGQLDRTMNGYRTNS